MAGEEVLSLSGIFIGVGLMVCFFVMAYLLYQIARTIKSMADKDEKYELFEEMLIDKVAKKKGFDLDKEAIKRDLFNNRNKRRNFRKRIEEEIYTEMFGKDKD